MRFTTVELVATGLVLVPVTTIDALWTLSVPTWIVRLVEVVELVGAKLQVAPEGNPEVQAKVTVPVKLFWGVIVIVAALLLALTVAVNNVVLGESVKLG